MTSSNPNIRVQLSKDFVLILSAGIASLILTVILFDSQGTGDLANGFILWLERADSVGFVESFNQTITAYPPLYILVPFLLTKLFGFSFFVSYKIFLLFGMLTLTLSIYRISRSKLMSLSSYIVLVIPTLGLGYGDVYLSALIIFSLKYLVSGRTIASGILFSLAVSLKFTPLILLPVIALILFNNNGGAKHISSVLRQSVRFAGGVAFFPALICVIFSPFSYLENLKLALLNGYLSGQAFNLGWLITAQKEFFGEESERMLVPGVIRFTYIDVHSGLYAAMKYSATLLILLYLFTKINNVLDLATSLKLCVVVVWIYYSIAPGVHENHLLIVAPLCLLVWKIRAFEGYLLKYILILSIANPMIFYGWMGEATFFRKVYGCDYTIIISGINLFIFLSYYLAILFSGNMKDREQVKIPRPY